MIAALFVETDGCYFNLPDVDPWDVTRDARLYAGPHPVVAHPPCQRWGRFWHGSPRKPHQYKLGDDGGCFRSALEAVLLFGGVLEHPADSHAWDHHAIPKPKRGACWLRISNREWTCYVEQGHYGHAARKGTWLYYCGKKVRQNSTGRVSRNALTPSWWSATATNTRAGRALSPWWAASARLRFATRPRPPSVTCSCHWPA